MQTPILFLIADGMGDYPVPELQGRTPLEDAFTPHMDRLASRAMLGRCRTIPPGLPAGSDIANMALFGYDPLTHHTGRGPIEAAAQGLLLGDEDLVYRLNLCTVSELSPEGVMLDYCAGHIPTEQAARLIGRLQESVATGDFRFVPGVQYRHLLIQKQGQCSIEAGLTINPPHDILGRSLSEDLDTFAASPELSGLVRDAAALLKDPENTSQANAVWPWGQGPPLQLPDFFEAFGLRGAVISAVDLVKGLGRAAGCEVLEVPGATGLLETNYRGKMEAARGFLERGDFVFLHLEGPDECGHAGSPRDKKLAIERFDAEILGPLLLEIERRKAGCLVACDHLTPVAVRTHTPEPVPFLFYQPGNPAMPEGGPGMGFSEAAASQSELFLDAGSELLPWILHTMGAGKP